MSAPAFALTAAQRRALDRLLTIGIETLPRGGGDGRRVPHIVTGLNTHVLHSLRKLGLIACDSIWLRGHVSPDLQITPAGRASAAAAYGLRPLSAPPAPRKATGLRRIRQNRYDNWYGYEGKRRVEMFGNDAQGTAEEHARAWLGADPKAPHVYRPDHNTECLTCDEPASAHARPGIHWIPAPARPFRSACGASLLGPGDVGITSRASVTCPECLAGELLREEREAVIEALDRAIAGPKFHAKSGDLEVARAKMAIKV